MRPACSFGNSALEVFTCFFSPAILVSCNLPPHLYVSQLLSLSFSLSSTHLPFTLRTGNNIMSPSAGGWHALPCWTQEWMWHKLCPKTRDCRWCRYIMQKISKSEHGSSPLFPHPDGIPERIFPGSLDLGARQGRLDGAKCTYRFKEKSCFLWIRLTWSGHLWLSIILFFPF